MTAEGQAEVGYGARERPRWSGGPLDTLFTLSIIGCVAATLLMLVSGTHGHAILPTIDLVMDTVALVVCAALTTLALARYRERRVIPAIYHAGAFQALAVAYGIAVVVSLHHSASISSLGDPESVQVLVFAVSRLAAAVLFVLAGVLMARRTYGWFPVWILVAPTAVVLLAGLAGVVMSPPPDPLQIITFTDPSGLPTITPFGAIVHLVTAGLFFVGAYASRELWRAGRAVIDGWIAVGLVFAGFAELHWMLYPSAHPGQVSTADLLRLGFSLALLLGLESSVRVGLRELRAANAELTELRNVEVQRAALEERSRLARELHDGLAQDLWLAKLRTGELASRDDLPADARRTAAEAVSAIDTGLGEAREAVAALRNTSHDESGFCVLVQRLVEDHGDRYGIRTEFAFEGEHDPHVAARTQAEVLRIAQEALTNVARHADATVVGVRLAMDRGWMTLRIVDNGRGFDLGAVGPAAYGLASMRERARLIHGRLRVLSRVGSGTTVVLRAPVVAPAGVAVAVER